MADGVGITDNGRWKFRVTGNIHKWFNHKHGQVSYFLTQVIIGHGSFGHYHKRFKIRKHDNYKLYGNANDIARHAVFNCDAQFNARRTLCVYLRIDELLPENLIMLKSANDWDCISQFCSEVMKKRMELERNEEHESRRNEARCVNQS